MKKAYRYLGISEFAILVTWIMEDKEEKHFVKAFTRTQAIIKVHRKMNIPTEKMKFVNYRVLEKNGHKV